MKQYLFVFFLIFSCAAGAEESFDVATIRVMEAGWIDIRTIRDADEIESVMKHLTSEIGPESKEWVRREFNVVVKSNSGSESSYYVFEDGTVYYFSELGSFVTKKYRIADIAKLRAALIGK